jgi:hypothetical protein
LAEKPHAHSNYCRNKKVTGETQTLGTTGLTASPSSSSSSNAIQLSVYIDGANPLFIKSLKLQIREDPDYDKVIARYKSDVLGDKIHLNMFMLR